MPGKQYTPPNLPLEPNWLVWGSTLKAFVRVTTALFEKGWMWPAFIDKDGDWWISCSDDTPSDQLHETLTKIADDLAKEDIKEFAIVTLMARQEGHEKPAYFRMYKYGDAVRVRVSDLGMQDLAHLDYVDVFPTLQAEVNGLELLPSNKLITG